VVERCKGPAIERLCLVAGAEREMLS